MRKYNSLSGAENLAKEFEKPMAEPVTMDILVRLARVNGDLIKEQKTATDTATVNAGLIEGADAVFAVWATNPADPDLTQFEAVLIKGQHLLGQNIDVKVTAIAVNNERKANSLRIHLGDGHNEKNCRRPEGRLRSPPFYRNRSVTDQPAPVRSATELAPISDNYRQIELGLCKSSRWGWYSESQGYQHPVSGTGKAHTGQATAQRASKGLYRAQEQVGNLKAKSGRSDQDESGAFHPYSTSCPTFRYQQYHNHLWVMCHLFCTNPYSSSDGDYDQS
jgi:hypothetical protein